MRYLRRVFIVLAAGAFFIAWSAAQKVETVNGTRVVHNEKGGAWGASPQVKIELVRKIGGLDEPDPNLSFAAPYDVVRDSAGNIYVLDTRDKCVQKLDAEGKFLISIGRGGQGPGEFQSASSLDIDAADNLFVFDAIGRKIEVFSSDGKPLNTIKFETPSVGTIRRLKSRQFIKGGRLLLRDVMEGSRKLPKLLSIIDRDGRTLTTFCEATDYKDPNVNSSANSILFDRDAHENIVVGFLYQNRIDKYASGGTLTWRADRHLNYGTGVIDKGFIKRDEGGTSIQAPKMNMVSLGIAADGAGRIWVNTYNRQMSPEELGESITIGGVTRATKRPGIEKTDIYKLEIFDPAGILLGDIPLDHLAHGLRIFGDALFIWDAENAAVYQYKIVEIS
jgi:hypothetical protein